jgi:hypothetical protein
LPFAFTATQDDVRRLTVCYTNKQKAVAGWGSFGKTVMKWLYPPQKKANTIEFNLSSGRVGSPVVFDIILVPVACLHVVHAARC